MKIVMHKIAASVLFLASGIPIALVLFFHVKQQAIRYEMKERLEEQILQTITLSETDVHWVKKKKEILFNGKMFDIKSFTVEKGQYKFTGLYDDQETELTEQLENNFNKNNDTGIGLIANLFQWLQSVYPGDNSDALEINILVQTDPLFLNAGLTSPYRTILTPPPQHC